MAEAQAFLAALDAENDAEKLRVALDGIAVLLEPLVALGSAGQPNIDVLRPVARVHGPYVTSLIKSMGARLSPNLKHSHDQLIVFGDAACLGLNALDCLRPVLKASRHELDVQRYNFVRKMAAYGLFEHAMAQGKLLLASVAASPGTVAGPADLHIAAIANVLVCYSELVKQGASRAEALWSEVHGPVDALLGLARDAAEAHEAAKRLEPVLKCLSKVAETLQYASVVCKLSSEAVAQQLSALTLCGALCRQEQAVTQMLVDDAAAAPDTVKLAMAEALVHLIAAHGTLPVSLRPMLHQLVSSLAQKRVGHPSPLDDRLHAGQPLAAVVRATLLLPHCSLANSPDEELCALLRALDTALTALVANSGASGQADLTLRWCCLDGLRVAVGGILTQLLSAPQAAGGYLLVLSRCMELLCAASMDMLGSGVVAEVDVAIPSGTSAVTVAVRLQVAHALCTGQVSALHQDMPRFIELLRQLLNSPKQRHRSGGSGGVGPAALYSLSASLGNAGLDLLQAQHAVPAGVLLQAAVELALERVRQMCSLGNPVPDADVSQLIKKCKTHVTALQQVSAHEAAMAAATAYVVKLHAVIDGKAHLVWSLTKQFVQSSLATYDAAVSAAAAAAPQPPAPAGAATTSAPAAPCKAQRRGGRLQRMQPNTQPESSQPDVPAPSAAFGQSAAPKTALVLPRALVQSLAAAAMEKAGRAGLLNALDMYAVQELEVVREESKRREEEDRLQSLYGAAVLEALAKCASSAGSSQGLRARELLVKAMTCGASLEAQISDLRGSCELLDAQLAGIQEGRALPLVEIGLLDSAALAHAQLGLCLAQRQLATRSCAAEGPSGHIGQAIVLWRRLLAGHAGEDAALLLRMPQATLHAALQVQQFVHLHADAHPEAAGYSGDVVWRLVRVLVHQVKLREQHIYLLSATMPLTTCTAWALGVQPTVPLGEACMDVQQHRKLAEVLKVTEPIRNVYATDATDHVAVASIADACAAELERSGFLRHGPAPLLLRSQCHQLAAAAYLRAGKTSRAYAQVQEALRITCGLLTRLDCPALLGRDGAAGDDASAASSEAADLSAMTPAEAAAAAVKSGAATSTLDYASDAIADSAEQPSLGKGAPSSDHADKTGSEEVRSGRGLTVGLAWAVAAAHLASLHNAARVFEAAGCVEDAIFLWKECGRTAELFGAAGVRSLCCAYLSELSCRRGDAEAAAAHLEAAGAVASTTACENHAASGGVHTIEAALLTAHSCSARARLALLREQHQEVDDACQSGVGACGAALAAAHRRQAAGRCSSSCADARQRNDALAWHGICLRAQLERLRAEALLQLGRRQEAGQCLQAALAQLQQAAAACSKRSAAEVWPVDYGLVLAHRAASVAPHSCGSASIVGLGNVLPTSGGVKEASAHAYDSVMSDTADESMTADQSSKRGTKAKTGSSSSRSHAKQEHPQTGAPVTDATCCSVPALLHSLQLCWQLPLAAVYACRQLLNASIALGMPYAATMFLHLGHGTSYAQQQALQRESARCASQAARQPSEPSASTRTGDASASSVTADDAAARCKAGKAASVFTTNVRDAALSMLSDLDMDGATGSGSFAALERGAEAWLRRTLSALPAGAVVSAIIQDSQAGQLLVSRASCDGTPVLAVLPGPGADAATAGSSASHVLDRCVARLRELLDESGDSMHIDQDAAASQTHKAKWWKTRVTLDTGVKGLLQELDEQCLGPWRCLLLPVPGAHLGVWRAAADSFIGEHFSSVLEGSGDALVGSRVGVLRELLSVALSGMRHVQGGDLATFLGVVCAQLGVSGGASSSSSLAVELAAAEAAARVQLLKLQPAEQGTGPDSSDTNHARCADASPGSTVTGRGTGLVAGRTIGCRTAAAPPAARARTGAACAPPQGAAVGPKLGLRESSRRMGAASTSVADPVDSENAPPMAALDAPGRARRTTRPLTMQPEPPSSQAAASKSTTRGASTRLATRSRTGAAVIPEDQPTKAEAGRSTAPASAQPEPTISAGASSKPEAGGAAHMKAGPVLLLLSPALHALPWESIPCCHGRELYRILSLPVACATAAQHTGTGGASGSSEFSGRRRPSSAAGDVASAFYVLNPSGDLTETQRFFQPILEAQPHWEGIIGERPSALALLEALQSRDLFLYFGHGSGEQFLSLPALRKLQRCATCILMGCSSGRLRLHGAYDPSGAAVAYLLAGCPALVANLWDVTDRDIDRYCQALMHAWLGCAGSQRAGPDVQGSEPLGMAVTSSRGACKLTYLIGAAPVCYGLPPACGSLS